MALLFGSGHFFPKECGSKKGSLHPTVSRLPADSLHDKFPGGLYVLVAGTYGLYLNSMVNKQGDAIDLTGLFFRCSLLSCVESVLVNKYSEVESAFVRGLFGLNKRVALAVKTDARLNSDRTMRCGGCE